MRSKLKVNTGYGQFRWVVLLLTVAVILPTVCLLWFMSQAVRNERLVIRQRLIGVYQSQLEETVQKVNEDWLRHCRQLEQKADASPYDQFIAATGSNGFSAFVIYDESGRRFYPLLSSDSPPATTEPFVDAWQAEFVDNDYAKAGQMYEQYAAGGNLAASIGQSRCLAKLNRIDEAISVCRQVAFSPLEETADAAGLSSIANARLLMVGWMRQRPLYAAQMQETFAKLLEILYRSNKAGVSLPTDQNLFLASKAIQIARETPPLAELIQKAHGGMLAKLVDAEGQSISLASQFPTGDLVAGWAPHTLHVMREPNDTTYAVLHKSSNRTYLALVSRDTVQRVLDTFGKSFQDDYIDYRIRDESNRSIAASANPQIEPFTAPRPIGDGFPGWSIELFFKEGDVLEEAAGRNIAVYTWTGMLVIGLILVSGALAAKSIGRQVKINRLKNDFIATVTHELKTPLASMRVLVDTLLEGHYREPGRVTEYLQLISRENERLSRLIDNFLTFSRMERNKQAFRMQLTDPAGIARTAAEAVKTKFAKGTCDFVADIAADLPLVHADPDAMVTVLVNLLDNAYKYTNDEKRIRMDVSSGNGSVRFVVTDNGIGIPRRALGRIFKRFYQVDRSLSRRAEGCGLGLSIAQFIIEAHNGTIRVDSKPGRGSTFTVTLPVADGDNVGAGSKPAPFTQPGGGPSVERKPE
jgi:nitrogen-specific signal transduction histidine kinase